MFGYMLNERIGKWAFWFISISVCVAFFPMFISGLDGQARRMYTYSESTGFGIWNMISFIGALGLLVGFVLIVYNILYSYKNSPRNISSDPWDARSLEWATKSPVPEYNFAITPTVDSTEAFWDSKKKGYKLFRGNIEKIHMPNNSGMPFIFGFLFFIWGFAFVFALWILLILATVAIFICLALRSTEKDNGRYISKETVEKIEDSLGGPK